MDETAMVREFETFVSTVEPGLRRALAGHLAAEAVHDALAEAFAYSWAHWATVKELQNPGGFLFRVAQSKARVRLVPALPDPDPVRLPLVEPGLGAAMRGLPRRQRSVVWLVHGCGWSYVETAEALGISASAVGTHAARALAALRSRLGVTIHE